jgi:hypothetical protein
MQKNIEIYQEEEGLKNLRLLHLTMEGAGGSIYT